MKKLTIVLLVLLSGCSILGDRRVAAGCQVADGVTTYITLKKGAIELNPLFASASPAAILAIKLVFAYVIWKMLPPIEKADSKDKFVGGAVSVLGCVPAINNYNVYK